LGAACGIPDEERGGGGMMHNVIGEGQKPVDKGRGEHRGHLTAELGKVVILTLIDAVKTKTR